MHKKVIFVHPESKHNVIHLIPEAIRHEYVEIQESQYVPKSQALIYDTGCDPITGQVSLGTSDN